MQVASFFAHCDVEMGDIVDYNGEKWTIYDIFAIHSLRNGNVFFRFILNHGERMKHADRHEFEYKGSKGLA